MTDPYEVLGVKPSASQDEIRRAYRALAKELHPDARPGDTQAEDRFKEVSAAFRLLSDVNQRARFDAGEIDASGRERPAFHFRARSDAGPSARGPSGRFEDIGDIFSDLFTDFGRANGARANGRPIRGADVRQKLMIELEEAVHGARRRVKTPSGRAIDVNIPPGVSDGRVLRLKDQGEPGQNGGPRGAALIEIGVKPHAWFKRDGADIRLDLPISVKEAVFGGKVRAPTIDGPVEVRVPPGSTSGAILRLRGKGAPDASGERGDQLIRLMVDVPVDDAALERFLDEWTPPAGYDPRKRFER